MRRAKNGAFEFKVDEESDLPLWVQLKRRMIFLIESGYYMPGDQLPTVRGLAAEANVNYNTVNKVYLSLASMGFIESVRGRGAFVLDLPAKGDEGERAEVEELANDFIHSCLDWGLSLDDIQVVVTRLTNKMKFELEVAESGSNVVFLSDKTRKAKGPVRKTC